MGIPALWRELKDTSCVLEIEGTDAHPQVGQPTDELCVRTLSQDPPACQQPMPVTSVDLSSSAHAPTIHAPPLLHTLYAWNSIAHTMHRLHAPAAADHTTCRSWRQWMARLWQWTCRYGSRRPGRRCV